MILNKRVVGAILSLTAALVTVPPVVKPLPAAAYCGEIDGQGPAQYVSSLVFNCVNDPTVQNVIDTVVSQLPFECSGLNQPLGVSNATLQYCLYALQNLQDLSLVTGTLGSVLDLAGSTLGSTLQPATIIANGTLRPNLSNSDYLRAYMLSKGTPEATLAAIRMTNRVTTPLAPRGYGYNWRSPSTRGTANWGGYVADTKGTSTQVNEADTDFVDVTQACGTCPALGAFAGVGGVNGQNLAQTGVDFLKQQAWFQFYPQDSVYMFNVNSGDEMHSSVSLDHDTGAWFVDIQDFNTGDYYADEYRFNPDTTSGEWIMETHGQLSSIGPLNFESATWVDGNGGTHNIDSDQANNVWKYCYNTTSPWTCPSDIGGDHRSFSIAY